MLQVPGTKLLNSVDNGDRSLSKTALTPSSTSNFLAILSHSKRQNVNSNRILHTCDNGEVLMWCDYLMKLNSLSPELMLSPYICDATFHVHLN